MHLTIDESFLIAPSNDLESKTVHDIAQNKGIDACVHLGRWGAQLTPDFLQNYQHLWQGKKHLILLELPGLEAEAILRDQGYTLHIIDHHQYSGIDRTHSQSSIEQFCDLFGFELSDYHKLVAHNDCDFIAGMIRAGANNEDILAIRKADRLAQGMKEELPELHEYSFPHIKLIDLQIWLVPLGEVSVGLAERIQTPKKTATKEKTQDQSHLIPCLLIFHDATDEQLPLACIKQVEFYGQASQRPQINAIVANNNWQRSFKLWSGGGRLGAFMGAKTKPICTQADIDELINAMLEAFLVAGKPLLDYNCTFYLPLDAKFTSELGEANLKNLQVVESDDVKKVELEPHDLQMKGYLAENNETDQNRLKQASEYMFTRVKDQMFEEQEDHAKIAGVTSCKHFRLTAKHVCCATLSVEDPTPPTSIIGKIDDVSLYQFHNQLMVLALRIKMPTELRTREHNDIDIYGSTWWHSFFTNNSYDQELWGKRQIDHWLRYTKIVRVLYPSYFEQLTEQKIAELAWTQNDTELVRNKVEDHFNQVVIHILGMFFPKISSESWHRWKRLRFVDTNNMHTNVAYSCFGTSCAKQDIAYHNTKRLFSLALFVDQISDSYGAANGFNYDQDFLESLLEKHQYHRWDDIGTQIGFSPYSAAFVGYGRHFHKAICQTHVPYIYSRMIVEALYYKNCLAHFDRRITEATTDLVDKKHHSNLFRELRSDFIEFTNHYWVRQFTPEIQGQEIYLHITSTLGLEANYLHIKDQMERADEYSATLRDRYFGLLALLLALLSIIGTFATVSWLSNIMYDEMPLFGLTLAQLGWLIIVILICLFIVWTLPTPCAWRWLMSKLSSISIWVKTALTAKGKENNDK